MNEPPVYLIDTHALLWFLSKDRKLSSDAKAILGSAAEVLVPTVVLAEAVSTIEKRRVQVTIENLLSVMETAAFVIVPFGADEFRAMLTVPSSIELHDRIIAATAKTFNATVLTRDPAFSGVVQTLW
jgi:PIN domain nuclease of toxin-antitoxin system